MNLYGTQHVGVKIPWKRHLHSTLILAPFLLFIKKTHLMITATQSLSPPLRAHQLTSHFTFTPLASCLRCRTWSQPQCNHCYLASSHPRFVFSVLHMRRMRLASMQKLWSQSVLTHDDTEAIGGMCAARLTAGVLLCTLGWLSCRCKAACTCHIWIPPHLSGIFAELNRLQLASLRRNKLSKVLLI